MAKNLITTFWSTERGYLLRSPLTEELHAILTEGPCDNTHPLNRGGERELPDDAHLKRILTFKQKWPSLNEKVK